MQAFVPAAQQPLLDPDECIVFGCPILTKHGYPMCPQHSTEFSYGDGEYRSPETQFALIRAISGRVGNCWEPRLLCGKRGYSRVRFSGQYYTLHRLMALLDCDRQCGPVSEFMAMPDAMVLHDRECEYLFRRGLLHRRCVNPAHLRFGSSAENADDILRVSLMIADYERGLSDIEVFREHHCDWHSLGNRIDSPPVEPA